MDQYLKSPLTMPHKMFSVAKIIYHLPLVVGVLCKIKKNNTKPREAAVSPNFKALCLWAYQQLIWLDNQNMQRRNQSIEFHATFYCSAVFEMTFTFEKQTFLFGVGNVKELFSLETPRLYIFFGSK